MGEREKSLKLIKELFQGDVGISFHYFYAAMPQYSANGLNGDISFQCYMSVAKVIYTPRIRVKTALKDVRIERAESALDVAYKSSGKKKPGGGSSSGGSGGEGSF